MTTTIRIWRSFSCNNSSSFRLVARFADAATAAETEQELRGFFVEHGKQLDKVIEDNDYTFPEESPAAAQALAKKYGFAWDHVLSWGDTQLEGDEPALASAGEVLVVHHTYCGGFGEGIPAYLRARGALEVEAQRRETPTISVLFRYTGGNANLDEDLDDLFAQLADETRYVDELDTPWKTRWTSHGRIAFFRDAKTVGLYFPISPFDLPAFRGWLVEHGIEGASIRLCEYADEEKFVAIAKARCTACNGALEYWDPRLHDIHSEQLACLGCGGMYDLSAIVALAKQAAEAPAFAKPAIETNGAGKKPVAKEAAAAAKAAKKPAAKQPATKAAAKKSTAKQPAAKAAAKQPAAKQRAKPARKPARRR